MVLPPIFIMEKKMSNKKNYGVTVWKGSRLILKRIFASYEEVLDVTRNYCNNSKYKDSRVEFYGTDYDKKLGYGRLNVNVFLKGA